MLFLRDEALYWLMTSFMPTSYRRLSLSTNYFTESSLYKIVSTFYGFTSTQYGLRGLRSLRGSVEFFLVILVLTIYLRVEMCLFLSSFFIAISSALWFFIYLACSLLGFEEPYTLSIICNAISVYFSFSPTDTKADFGLIVLFEDIPSLLFRFTNLLDVTLVLFCVTCVCGVIGQSCLYSSFLALIYF